MKQSVGKSLTAGGSTTLFTVPAGYSATVTMVLVSNVGASAKTFSVVWYAASALTVQGTTTLGAADYLIFGGDGTELVLQEGDSIRVTTEAASSFTGLATLDLVRTEKTPFIL